MKARTSVSLALVTVVAVLAIFSSSVRGQVGKGLIDPNVASEKDLLALPHMTPALVKSMIGKRPLLNMRELNAFLLTQSLTPPQLAEIYRKAFIHINLNTASPEEIMLIPGAGKRMAHEFEEYRPWKSFAQFNKEIGKYVDQAEVARLAQYCFIPINLNTASDEDLMSIPGMGPRMLREFKEYRPYKAIEQFRKEIGKYVNDREVARLERYVTIQ